MDAEDKNLKMDRKSIVPIKNSKENRVKMKNTTLLIMAAGIGSRFGGGAGWLT